MNCQQSGDDAEVDAETLDPVHLRFAARPGMSALAVMRNKHSLDLVNDRNRWSVSMLHRKDRNGPLLNAAMAVVSLNPI